VKARREAAIVAPIPGTTRDVIEVSTDVAGMPVIFADTAGLRPTDDHVETLGIERAAKEYAMPFPSCLSPDPLAEES
jgi:tRNA modification GTPase